MEPIDRRITAPKLIGLKNEPHATAVIAEFLGVPSMSAADAARTGEDIAEFLERGDATSASQLIHAASVRRGHARPTRGA